MSAQAFPRLTPEEYLEIPEVTDEWFEQADFKIGDVLVKKGKSGRPKSAAPKQSVHLRLSPDVLDHFRASGPGWQTRIDETLRKASKLAAPKR